MALAQKLNSEEFSLCVFSNSLVLAKLNEEFVSFESCLKPLQDLLLFNKKYCLVERKFGSHLCGKGSSTDGSYDSNFNNSSSSNSNNGGNSSTGGDGDGDSGDISDEMYMWGFWHNDNEVTFLLDENDVEMFPEGALTISQQRWSIVKLVGRPISFDESGIISLMSDLESNISSLNISTTTTNCCLLPQELLDVAIEELSLKLGLNVMYE